MTAQSTHRTALGLGANLGDPRKSIARAVAMLRRNGLAAVCVSPLYETAPVDCVPGTPNFANGALCGLWPAGVEELFHLCKWIEHQLGRPSDHSSREARAIDLDILLFDEHACTDPELTIPHPLLTTRLFVLTPLVDIAPDWRIPTQNRTVREAFEALRIATPPADTEVIRQLPGGEGRGG